jgi:hypothetical protein
MEAEGSIPCETCLITETQKNKAVSQKGHICKYMFIGIFCFIFNVRHSHFFRGISSIACILIPVKIVPSDVDVIYVNIIECHGRSKETIVTQ